MNKLVLSVLGIAAVAALSSPAQARDHRCDSGYGYSQSYVRVYRAEHPDYDRSYHHGYRHSYPSYHDNSRNHDNRRCEPHSDAHHGLHGLIERLFR